MRKIFSLFAALTLSVGLFADATPVVSPVAELPRPYSPTQIRNGSFDEEPFMIFSYNDKFYTQDSPSRETDDLGGEFADSIIFNGVGQGWNTTSNKIGNSSFFEYVTEYTAYGIYITYNSIIPASDKFVEMNCEQAAMLYQDLNTYGGDIIRWTLKHGHRQYADPVQPMRVEIGAPMSDINGNIINAHGYDSNIQPEINPASLAKYTYDKVTDSNDGTSTLGFGNADELAPLRLDENVENQGYGWHVAKGVYIVPEGQRVTRFGFISEASNPVEGNLLDDITFSTLIGNLNAVADNENNVTVTGYWGDDDNTKHLMVKIGNSGTPLGLDMTSVLNKNFSFIVPAATIGQATTVTIYHEDYPQACRVVTISHEALYTVTMLTGTNGFGITDRVDYKYNATATAEAFATLPYEFKRWEDGNGNVLSTDNPYSFTIQKNTTLLPIFATPANKHVVTVITDGNGRVSGLPLFNLYDVGATATLTAVPNNGYELRQWEDGNGVVLSTDNPFIFTITQDTTIKPLYQAEQRSYEIATGVTAQMGTLNKNLPWTKTPTKPGLAYMSATGHDGQDSRDTLVITPEDGVSYRLTFDYAVSSEGGWDKMSVWVNETLIADQISGEVSGSYDSKTAFLIEPGQTATIVMSYAKDEGGYVGEDRGYIYNIQVTAFTTPPAIYTATVLDNEEGTVSGLALEGKYISGDEVSLTATPNNIGFELKEWQDGNGTPISTANPLTFTITQDTIVKPIYQVEQRSYEIATGVTAQMGTLNKNLPWTKTPTKPGLAYMSATGHDGQDSRDTLVITPEDGVSYRLTFDYAVSSEGGWDKMSVWVNETLIADQISGEVSGSYDSKMAFLIEPGQTATIVMSYAKDGSGDDGDDRGYIYNIQVISYDTPPAIYTVSVLNGEGGSVTGLASQGKYILGEDVSLTAITYVGYEFKEWQDGNGSQISTANPLTFTITQDTTIKPLYQVEQRSYEIATGVTAQMGTINKSLPWTKTAAKPGLAYWSATGHDGQDSRDTLVITPEAGVSYRLKFDYAVSSEGTYDWMNVWVNGVVIADEISYATSGSYDSGEMLLTEPTTIVMSYSKDYSGDRGDDRGYIYNIVVTSNAPYPVYTRDVTNGSWGTICLPWESTALEGGDFYDVLGTKHAEYGVALVELGESDQLEAGKPYVFKATSEQIKVTYNPATEVEDEVEGNHIIGSFTGRTVPKDMYIIYQDLLYKSNGANTIGEYRAYFDVASMGAYNPATAPARVVFFGGRQTPTGLEEQDVRCTMHDGKYLINGQFVIIKDNKMYNAQGIEL